MMALFFVRFIPYSFIVQHSLSLFTYHLFVLPFLFVFLTNGSIIKRLSFAIFLSLTTPSSPLDECPVPLHSWIFRFLDRIRPPLLPLPFGRRSPCVFFRGDCVSPFWISPVRMSLRCFFHLPPALVNLASTLRRSPSPPSAHHLRPEFPGKG